MVQRESTLQVDPTDKVLILELVATMDVLLVPPPQDAAQVVLIEVVKLLMDWAVILACTELLLPISFNLYKLKTFYF